MYRGLPHFLEKMGGRAIHTIPVQELHTYLLQDPGEMEPEKEREAFWSLRSVSDELFPLARWSVFVAYAAGFALLLWVMYENLRYVVRVTFW